MKWKAYSIGFCKQNDVVGVREEWKDGPDTARVFVGEDRVRRIVRYSACGRMECMVSTGIHDGATHGWGELNPHGYWEHPCWVCARDRERRYPEDGPAWPFSDEELAKIEEIHAS